MRALFRRLALGVAALVAALAPSLLPAAPAGGQAPVVDLGVPFWTFASPSATLLDVGGRYAWLASDVGYPAVLAAVDPLTGAPLFEARVPGAHVVWSYAQAPDGTVYLGTAPQSQLFAYTPGAPKAVLLGTADASSPALFSLAYDPATGMLYGGLANQAELMRYDPATHTFALLGSLAPHHAFVKALAVSGSTVLAGLGGPAGLVAYDTATGTATTVPLPPGMSRAEAVDSVQVVGQLVFVHVTAGGEAVYRLPSLTLVRTWGNVQSPGVTPQGMAGQVAYVAQGKVWAYHLATGSVTPLSPHLPPYQQTYLSTVQTVAIAQVPDPQAPGQTMVVGLASKGTYWTLSPQGTLLEGPVSVVASAGSINSLAVGPDGLVYGSSYLSGSTFAYNPATRSLTVYPGPGQAESMAADGSTLLLGVYPSATLWRLNPYAPWSWQNPQGAPNPVYLGSIGHQQDRPVSMVVAPDGTVYVATVPVAGELGGALAVVSASGQVVAVYRNLLPHESPISLVMSHGWVVGSTTVSGGVGAHPIASRAQLFVWDPATARLRATLTPFPGVPAIAGLAVGPHGTVYGLTHRVLFAYDPVQNRILWTQTLPWAQGGTPGYGSFSWGSDTSLVEAPDGNLYGCVDGHAFVANPYTQSIQSLYANGVVKVVVTPQDQVFLVGNGGTHLYELAFSAPSSQTP